MTTQKRNSPFDSVGHALPLVRARYPHFEIFKAIVVLHPVDVVNRFVVEKFSAKVFPHNVAMLKKVFSFAPHDTVSLRGDSAASELSVGHAASAAGAGAVSVVLITQYRKVVAAMKAFPRFAAPLSFCKSLAFVGTKTSQVSVRPFSREAVAAPLALHRHFGLSAFSGAVFGDGGFCSKDSVAADAGSVSLNPFVEFSASLRGVFASLRTKFSPVS